MSIEAVREHLKKYNKENDIVELEESSATVLEAANALHTKPERIAKTISLRCDDGAMLVLMAGDVKIDNIKFRSQFGYKPRMLSCDEAYEYTGHKVGGICPFGLKQELPIYLDSSLKRFETVFPACGSSNSAIELTLKELEEITNTKEYIDVCKYIDEEKNTNKQ